MLGGPACARPAGPFGRLDRVGADLKSSNQPPGFGFWMPALPRVQIVGLLRSTALEAYAERDTVMHREEKRDDAELRGSDVGVAPLGNRCRRRDAARAPSVEVRFGSGEGGQGRRRGDAGGQMWAPANPVGLGIRLPEGVHELPGARDRGGANTIVNGAAHPTEDDEAGQWPPRVDLPQAGNHEAAR